MAFKEHFIEGEWDPVVQAPMLAGFAVTAADPGGLVGSFQESAAIVARLRQAAGEEATLASEVANAYLTGDGRKTAVDGVKRLIDGKSLGEASSAAIAGLSDIMAIIERRAPNEVEAFKAFLVDIARCTAEAAKEGGFLGFGGESVSAAERQALNDLQSAIGA